MPNAEIVQKLPPALSGGRGLRIGAVVGSSIFLLDAAGGHIRQMMIARNFAPGNPGVISYLILLRMEHAQLRIAEAAVEPNSVG
ncbi:MAG: DUF6790 family protein [Acidobacteriaceae bacterium]